ncbi:MAG: flagellar protein FliB, partial [Clostridia bacterium]|nr:flagellar protein FliB [Clostridia bacterium]
MKTIYPSYLDKFNCIADKCPDTCCAGWKVCIDNNTYKKYKSVKGEFKKVYQKYQTVLAPGNTHSNPVPGLN